MVSKFNFQYDLYHDKSTVILNSKYFIESNLCDKSNSVNIIQTSLTSKYENSLSNHNLYFDLSLQPPKYLFYIIFYTKSIF